MRPTVEEQLLGTCRILEQVVAPCVGDAYARTMLDGLVANLRMLTAALPAVPGFLQDDNRATAALLAQLQPAVAPDLAAAMDTALQSAEPQATHLAALEARNRELRELLSQALGGTELTPALREAVLAHMASRAARSPMRYVSTAPSPPKAS